MYDVYIYCYTPSFLLTTHFFFPLLHYTRTHTYANTPIPLPPPPNTHTYTHTYIYTYTHTHTPLPPPLPHTRTPPSTHHTGITHGLISTPRMRALEMLKKFLKAKPEVASALIFVNDPHRVEIIYEKLLEMGFIAAPLHGESSKDDRKVRNMERTEKK